jgi:hypothetical protein
MHEEVHQFGQVLSIFDQQQEGHLRVDQLSRNRVEVYLDGVLLLALARGVDCLKGEKMNTL